MSEFLFHYYPVHPTTWVYLSSLLMIGLFFKFSRFWSVRNLDLVLLILLAPGLLLVHFGDEAARQEREIAAVDLGEQDAVEAVLDDLDVLPLEEETAEPVGPQVTPPTDETPVESTPEPAIQTPTPPAATPQASEMPSPAAISNMASIFANVAKTLLIK